MVIAPLSLTLFGEALWVGFATVPLRFIVLDSATQRPVPAASIRLYGDPAYVAHPTGPDGTTTVTIKAMCSGRSSILRQTRTVNYGRWQLRVDAEGYVGLQGELTDRTTDGRFHEGKTAPPMIKVLLRKRVVGL
jgi:hypothetical protein